MGLLSPVSGFAKLASGRLLCTINFIYLFSLLLSPSPLSLSLSVCVCVCVRARALFLHIHYYTLIKLFLVKTYVGGAVR